MRDLPLPADRILTDPERIAPYARDEAERGALPQAVALPISTAEVSAVLRWADARRVPVVPRGAGSGLSGAAVPTAEAIVLSLERMTHVSPVDVDDMTVDAEPGVVTAEIRRAAEAKGLLYAPIPASVDFCTIGGNVATNAGGLCAVKYGVTREHVLGLEAVLPGGETIRTGGKLRKSSTGYNLTQLLCGSEGTLAVITRVTLKLLPLPGARMSMLVPFDSMDDLMRGVLAVLSGPAIPPTLEFLPRAAVRCVLERHPHLAFPFPDVAASLLIECDGATGEEVAQQIERIAERLTALGAGDPVAAGTSTQRDEIWTLRKLVRDSISNSGEYVEADGVVPRRRLPELLAAAEGAAADVGISQISYGHAGDGNLHTYFLRGPLDDRAWAAAAPKALEGLFRRTAALGGTISGEHGIGRSKRDYLPLALSADEIALMRRLKRSFDPNGILNPGKIFPDLRAT